MTYEEKIEGLESLLRGAPEVLSPLQGARWTHQSKNTVYDLIKTERLKFYVYHGKFLIAKADLIEYMADTTDDMSGKRLRIGGKNSRQSTSPVRPSA